MPPFQFQTVLDGVINKLAGCLYPTLIIIMLVGVNIKGKAITVLLKRKCAQTNKLRKRHLCDPKNILIIWWRNYIKYGFAFDAEKRQFNASLIHMKWCKKIECEFKICEYTPHNIIPQEHPTKKKWKVENEGEERRE